MNTRNIGSLVTLTALVGVGLLASTTGCTSSGYASAGYASSAPAGPVVYNDDYIYYPEYEVYYSNTHHQYVYRDGRSWVRRSAPPQAWANRFPSAPSVRVDFHDAPERHHAEVVRNYPRTWKPQARPAQPRDDHRNDDHHDNDRRDDQRK
ncbi:MAG: hypothetical protein JWM32_1658 [Verrucomicrobia bacterium]|nr:hypothetical protein [Verrucomicrobiota bacterium]